MLARLQLQQTNRPLDVLLHWRDERHLNLSPPYQRGDVWGTTRRVNFLRSLLMGVPIASVIVNDRFAAEWAAELEIAVIDGKQRCTTILMWFDGLLRIPCEWLDPRWVAVPRDVVSWADLSDVGRRKFANLALPLSEGRLPTVEAEREVFELVNYGGVAQGCSDA